jgi:transposase
MKNKLNEKLMELTPQTLIVGVDIAKSEHWYRVVDIRGREIGKAAKIENTQKGFEEMVTEIENQCNKNVLRMKYTKIIIGMEPTGHYWKPIANYLIKKGYKVVCVNPYHTKKASELDDNSPTQSDKKDALTIARLVKDGRYFNPYMPQDVYAELRALTNARESTKKRMDAVKNTITAILDEYFPEIWEVFKNPLKGKASRQILKSCPFPLMILDMEDEEILQEIKKAVKKTVGMKKVLELKAAAAKSIGVGYGLEGTGIRLQCLLDEFETYERNIARIEKAMGTLLEETGYSEQILSIKGIGVVTASGYLGEVGDPLRFSDARQIMNYAGYNLTEDSSGKNKSGTSISKRGRKQLRSILYLIAFTMVSKNPEMKALYEHLTQRKNNPLKKKQALVVISKKVITVIYSMLKKQEMYNPERVLGPVRKERMAAAKAA